MSVGSRHHTVASVMRDGTTLVAVIDREIVAVARFDRLGDGDEAEVAIVVADKWQGRGLGTLLFRALAARARDVGIVRFRAETLGENGRMLNVFRHAELPCQQGFEVGVVHTTIELVTEPAVTLGPGRSATRPG